MSDRKSPEPKKADEPEQRPEHGAASQLHNYNVMLTRLGDLFDDNDERQPSEEKP